MKLLLKYLTSLWMITNFDEKGRNVTASIENIYTEDKPLTFLD